MLKVSEIFGPTFQGEGPSAGQRAAFVRLSGCNLKCSWCDTPYTWDWFKYSPLTEIHRMEAVDIAEQVHAMDCPLVVITGGEPLLQADELNYLAYHIQQRPCNIEIETNGTMPGLSPRSFVKYNVSPKLAHSGDYAGLRLNMETLEKWAERVDVRWKFVVKSLYDGAEIRSLQKELRIHERHIWVMPEGQTPEQLAQSQPAALRVAESLGYNYTDRLHIRLWGGERGR